MDLMFINNAPPSHTHFNLHLVIHYSLSWRVVKRVKTRQKRVNVKNKLKTSKIPPLRIAITFHNNLNDMEDDSRWANGMAHGTHTLSLFLTVQSHDTNKSVKKKMKTCKIHHCHLFPLAHHHQHPLECEELFFYTLCPPESQNECKEISKKNIYKW